jgi:hypothetical protein
MSAVTATNRWSRPPARFRLVQECPEVCTRHVPYLCERAGRGLEAFDSHTRGKGDLVQG